MVHNSKCAVMYKRFVMLDSSAAGNKHGKWYLPLFLMFTSISCFATWWDFAGLWRFCTLTDQYRSAMVSKHVFCPGTAPGLVELQATIALQHCIALNLLSCCPNNPTVFSKLWGNWIQLILMGVIVDYAPTLSSMLLQTPVNGGFLKGYNSNFKFNSDTTNNNESPVLISKSVQLM